MLYDVSAQLLFQSNGQCKLNATPEYIQYKETNWEQVAKFCFPYSVEKTKRGQKNGRTVIDLPSGNTSFEYGMVVVPLPIFPNSKFFSKIFQRYRSAKLQAILKP